MLHFSCRVTEKIVQQLLLCGMRHNGGAELEGFVSKVMHCVNQDILKRKNPQDPGWYFPLTDDKKQLSDVKLSNGMAREIAQGMTYLVTVCTEKCDVDQKSTWMEVAQRFPRVTTYLDSKEEMGFEQICEFQLIADKFCDAYFAVTGRDGMTNYLHCLYFGHFSWYLFKYDNLYRLCQQGWENVNGRFKRKFFKNSSRGGGKNKQSKLLPVFQSFLRENLWKVWYLDAFFQQLGHSGKEMDLDYGKLMKLRKNKDVSDEDVEKFAHTIFNFAPDMLDAIEEENLFGAIEEELI